MKAFPKELLIYVADYDEKSEPIYGVARNVDEIPEDIDAEKVGIYVKNRETTFEITRVLK